MDLIDKVALVTGGTMGIGAAIACQLADRGAHIALVARHEAEEAKQTVQAVESMGRQARMIRADVSRPEECRRCVEQTVNDLGRLDVLVHNAGGPVAGTIDQITPDDWHNAIDVHLSANFYLVRAALPYLRRQTEGVIITVSSVAGLRGVPGMIAYCTVKGAVTQFTRALARDLADENIRVNSVAPGIIRTRFHDGMSEERRRINLEQRVPLHREGTPQQVAEVVGLLVTNDYITGEVYTIDGGLTMRIV